MPRGGVSVKFSPQALAAVALLAAHEPILDVLLAPAPLAPQRHPFTPSATPPPMDMANLCGVETLSLASASANICRFCASSDRSYRYMNNSTSLYALIINEFTIGIVPGAKGRARLT